MQAYAMQLLLQAIDNFIRIIVFVNTPKLWFVKIKFVLRNYVINSANMRNRLYISQNFELIAAK